MLIRRVSAGAAAVITAMTLTACGSAQPQPSHADRLACRTIWRMQQLYDASGGIPAFAPGSQAAQSLAGAAAGTTQPLQRDMTTAAHALLLVNTPDTKQLAAMERDCTKLGINVKNAENA
jgi:hypothetical protein